MSDSFSDLLLALRLLRRSPGFTVTVVAVLALGIGANTAIFSVIHGAILNPFPYTNSDRIWFISSAPENQQDGGMPVTYPDYLDLAAGAKSFEGLTYARNRSFALTGVAEPANVQGADVSASAWELLGVPPQLGRPFTPSEDRPGADPVCLISASLWTGKLGSDPAILGRTLMLDGRSYTVIGVMPPRFKFWGADVWTPAGLEAGTELMQSRVLRSSSFVVGKTRPGISREAAQAELVALAAGIAAQHPDSNKGITARISLLSESVTGPLRQPLALLLGAVGFVLLIACANVANLLLARAATRQREFALRAALGASTGRLIRQLLLESLPLAVAGATAGVLLSAWGLDALLSLLPPAVIPAEARIEINTPVLLFSAGACLATLLLFALPPALELARTRFTGILQEGSKGSEGRRAGHLRSGLIIAEIALSLILLVGAGLLIRSFARLQGVNPGFNAAQLLTVPLSLPEARYADSDQATRFFAEVVDRARRLPGVTHVGAGTNVPFLGGSGIPLVTSDKTYSDLNELRGVQFSGVLGDYFKAQGLRLVKGRVFTDADRTGSEPVIILNEAAAKQFLGDKDPLGQQVMLGLPANLLKPGLLPPGLDRFEWARVVGVVETARHFGLGSNDVPAAYVPIDQIWRTAFLRNSMVVLLRTEGDPTAAAPGVRAIVAELDQDLPLGRVEAMERLIAESLRDSRFTAVLLALFAAIAGTLAVVGIYGVVSWNVTQRTRELGIRSALGAAHQDLIRLVVGHGLRRVLLGIGLGLAGSFALARLLQTMLFNTSAFDALTFAGVSLLLAAVALLACLVPARRASRISPMEALRSD